jgi:biotin transport system substrate-specific component
VARWPACCTWRWRPSGWLARSLAGRAAGGWAKFAGYLAACVVGGIAVVYACGVPWLAAVTKMGLAKAAMAVAVFLPGDLAKAVVAAWVASRVERVWPMLGR